MIIPLPVPESSQPGSFLYTTGFARRWKSSISPSLKATPQGTQKLLGFSGTSLSSHQGCLDGTTCMLIRKTDVSTVCSWSPEPVKLNSAFSRVARCTLPAAPPSRPHSQDILRRWERAAREQTVMCSQAAGLSRCLTRVQNAMSTQLKSLHMVKGKGKSSERMQQAVEEYLVSFNLPRCLCTPHPAFYPRTSWLRRVQIVWPQWSYQPWPQL